MLLQGSLVVIPTETLYGLAACPANEAALARLAKLKARQASKAVPLIASDRLAVDELARIPPELAAVAERFWPGPLTMALQPRRAVPSLLLSADATVGVRVSGLALVRELAKLCGGIITATSANLAGKPPPAHPDEVDEAVLNACSAVLDAGACPGGAPSTVLGLREGLVVLLRPGAITAAQLAAVLGYEPQCVASGVHPGAASLARS